MIPVSVLASKYGVQPYLVAHVGAHLAEESIAYRNQGWYRVHWFEANPELVGYLRGLAEIRDHSITEGVVSEKENEQVAFKIASNTFSSSIYDFGEHKKIYPKIETIKTLTITSVTLDGTFAKMQYPDFLNLDIQGAELKALKGGDQTLQNVKWLYTEVSLKELYVDGVQISELERHLSRYGYKRMALRINRSEGWGDALYFNTNFIQLTPKLLFYEFFSRLKWEAGQLIYFIRLKLHKLRRKSTNHKMNHI